ncbi:MAG: Rieske 2Fe-2S domain-containing protein [Deltaproteobacteria bacterium]|nr:MAG: Rieske 2Fe-2S domain-containing protein [Deltaproteobacteria bacterium]
MVQRRFPFPLPNGWFQVAYSDELRPGEVQRAHYFGGELVLFRGEDGRARVLDAHCPHLGAHLGHGGRVVGNAIRCPFHAWEFDGDGRCVRVPYAKKVPPKAAIRAWTVDEKNGLVFVHFHKAGKPPAFAIPEVPEYASEEWTDYYRRDWVIRTCNQELAENSVDPAHFKYVHRTAEVPTAKAWAEGPVFRANLAYPIATGTGTLHGEIEIYAYGFGFGVTYFKGIVHTVVVISGTPIDEERVHQRLSFMVKKLDSEEATAGLGNAFVSEISRQFSEDIPIWENKVYWERPVLCDGDGPIGVLRRWGRQFY